jgi:hypothetical protein
MNMKGWKTLLWNGGVVVATALATWAAGIDWTQYLSPTAAVIALAVVNVALRIFTTTAIGKAG